MCRAGLPRSAFVWLVAGLLPAGLARADQALPEDDVVLRAMVDELDRSLGLQLEGLAKPYFVQFKVQERTVDGLTGRFGALNAADHSRQRAFSSRVRVGGYELDNTNVLRGPGGGTTIALPLDDDYFALRQAMWAATDREYKRAVQILTRKRAYIQQKNIQDRPPDFSPAEAVQHFDPLPHLEFNQDDWTERVRRLSARFNRHEAIQNSEVTLVVARVTERLVNSEGTRLRTADTGALLSLSADLQAGDGTRLADSRLIAAESLEELPSLETLTAAVDALCQSLTELAAAPVLEEYTGPVLFDGEAAAQVFASLLAPGLAARPGPIGSRRSRDTSLEKRLGKRVLPATFRVYDDATVERFDGRLLFGRYAFDDEAVPARRVDLVTDGVLRALVASRAPTLKVHGSTGHGRTARFGADASAAVANLFITSTDGLGDEELKQELLDACQEEGLEFGLRITSLAGVGNGRLPDPLFACKVHAADGREEPVRNLAFRPVPARALRSLLASGREPYLLNHLTRGAASAVAPAVLFEELELRKVEQEPDRPPIVEAPTLRTSSRTGGTAGGSQDG